MNATIGDAVRTTHEELALVSIVRYKEDDSAAEELAALDGRVARALCCGRAGPGKNSGLFRRDFGEIVESSAS